MFDDLRLNKQGLIITLIVIIALAFGAGVKYAQWRLITTPIEIVEEPSPVKVEEEKPVEPAKIYVHVAGEVKKPGIYEVEEGARVEDALRLALPTEKADVDTYLNRAQILQDQDKIIVYSQQDPEEGIDIEPRPDIQQNPIVSVKGSGRVNINTAPSQDLEGLSGIGPAKARAIIDYRTGNGRFASIEEIMNVKGIGQATFDKIRDEITVN